MAETLRISCVEIQNAQKVELAWLTIRGQQYNVSSRQGDVLRESFNPALELSPQEQFLLTITYRGLFGFRKHKEIPIDSQHVLSDSQNLKYHLRHKKWGIVLDIILPADIATGAPTGSPVIPAIRRRSNESSTPTDDQLVPTTEELLKQCPHFRILVMGKSGVGKTTLINRTFGIKAATPAHDKRGQTDINKELISEMNNRFILHDSNGFEPGENDNLAVVKQFIETRKNHTDIKEQLHAVWLCFQIPLESHGQRMMEAGMEQFLREKSKILGHVPTVFVFTKYDKLTEMIESNWVDARRDYTDTDIETEAKKYLLSHCVGPIKNFTLQEFTYIAVSTKLRYNPKLSELIQLTHGKVSAYSESHQGTGPSPVPTVTVMAQRVSSHMKIDELIRVGKRRYWQAVISGADFPGHTIQDCLQVIHTDIANVWNFCNPSQELDSAFRECMLKLVSLLDDPSGAQPNPPRRSSTMEAMESEGGLSLVVLLPLKAGVAVLKWAYRTYNRVPDVQRKFMAYIVDLTHVMDILFTLTDGKGEQALTSEIIRSTTEVYRESERSRYVHSKIKDFPVSIFSSNDVISQVENLIRERYIQDDALRRQVESMVQRGRGRR